MGVFSHRFTIFSPFFVVFVIIFFHAQKRAENIIQSDKRIQSQDVKVYVERYNTITKTVFPTHLREVRLENYRLGVYNKPRENVCGYVCGEPPVGRARATLQSAIA